MQPYVFKKVDRLAPREGVDGTGLRLKQICIFCKGRFRNMKQRTTHASSCKEDGSVKHNSYLFSRSYQQAGISAA